MAGKLPLALRLPPPPSSEDTAMVRGIALATELARHENPQLSGPSPASSLSTVPATGYPGGRLNQPKLLNRPRLDIGGRTRRRFKKKRLMSRKYCRKTPCRRMGFTQKASCRPYKNCYTRRK